MGLPADFSARVARMRAAALVLMVGRVEPRKGHAQALAAFELLWGRGVRANLVIVGNVGWRVDELARRLRRHPENGTRLFWLEGLSDEALAKLYELADGVLLASEGEGFGLPLVEAARYGKPILAREIPVYREIAQGHASYFSGADAESLADALASWIGSIRTGNAPASSGVKTSTWAESARRMRELVLAARSS
jgi:glycosyltransferase involved in cell wall biosynthesis